MFKKIMVAADGSDHSVQAAEYARELAVKFGGSVDVVYVVNGENARADALHHNDPFEIEKARKEKLVKYVQNLKKRNLIMNYIFYMEIQDQP